MTQAEIQDILNKIEYRDWRFVCDVKNEVLYLVIAWVEPDSFTGKPTLQKSRKWMLSAHAVKSEIVQTALKAVLTAEEHEARERFKYRGQRIFGPHFDVDALHASAKAKNLDYRGKAY